MKTCLSLWLIICLVSCSLIYAKDVPFYTNILGKEINLGMKYDKFNEIRPLAKKIGFFKQDKVGLKETNFVLHELLPKSSIFQTVLYEFKKRNLVGFLFAGIKSDKATTVVSQIKTEWLGYDWQFTERIIKEYDVAFKKNRDVHVEIWTGKDGIEGYILKIYTHDEDDKAKDKKEKEIKEFRVILLSKDGERKKLLPSSILKRLTSVKAKDEGIDTKNNNEVKKEEPKIKKSNKRSRRR